MVSEVEETESPASSKGISAWGDGSSFASSAVVSKALATLDETGLLSSMRSTTIPSTCMGSLP